MIFYNASSLNSSLISGKAVIYKAFLSEINKDGKGYLVEKERFKKVQNKLINNYDILYKQNLDFFGEEQASLFLTYKNLCDDLDFEDFVDNELKKGRSAEFSINLFIEQIKENWNNSSSYISERLEDFISPYLNFIEDLQGFSLNLNIIEDSILVCEDITFDEFCKLNYKNIKAVICLKGTNLSHISIFLNSLKIPYFYDVKDLKLEDFKSEQMIYLYKNRISFEEFSDEEISNINKEEESKKSAELEYFLQTEPKFNGEKVNFRLNVGDINNLEEKILSFSDGIGLVRSEYLLLSQKFYPSIEEQIKYYEKILEKCPDKDVYIRLFDLGLDKKPAYLFFKNDEIYSYGLRGVDVYREYPLIIHDQIYSILAVFAKHKNIKILIPMVNLDSDIDYIKELFNSIIEELHEKGINTYIPNIGSMIETPIGVKNIDSIVQKSDFISIGTNDLTQYTLNLNRDKLNFTNLTPEQEKKVFEHIKTIVNAANKYGKKVSVCGEMATRKEYLFKFLNYGITNFSTDQSFIAILKKYVADK